MTQTIWIARHANRLDFVNPAWFNTAERPYDPPISEDGAIQAQQLAKRLQGENICHIFASPFLRTVQTAHIIAEVLDLPLKLEWGLCEWLNPHWMPAMPETLSMEVLKAKFPRIDSSYKSRIQPIYPETDTRCWQRGGKTARILAGEFSEDILLVGHGVSVIATTRGLVNGIEDGDINASLCCLVKVVRRGVNWKMELNGDTSHLSGTEASIRFN